MGNSVVFDKKPNSFRKKPKPFWGDSECERKFQLNFAQIKKSRCFKDRYLVKLHILIKTKKKINILLSARLSLSTQSINWK